MPGPRLGLQMPDELTMTAIAADVMRSRVAAPDATRTELVALIDSHMRTIDGLLAHTDPNESVVLTRDREGDLQKEALHIAALAVRITEGR